MFFKKKEWPWPLKNSAEASLFAQLLQEEKIPYRIIRHGDSLWAYAMELTDGWGHVEVDDSFKEQLEVLYKDFKASEPPQPEDFEVEP
jgi:hypothetical protein